MEGRLYHTGIFVSEDSSEKLNEILHNFLLYNSGARMKFGNTISGECEILLESVNNKWSDFSRGTSLLQNFLNSYDNGKKTENTENVRLSSEMKMKELHIAKLDKKRKKDNKINKTIQNHKNSLTDSNINKINCNSMSNSVISSINNSDSVHDNGTHSQSNNITMSAIVCDLNSDTENSFIEKDGTCTPVTPNLTSSKGDKTIDLVSPLIVDMTKNEKQRSKVDSSSVIKSILSDDNDCVEVLNNKQSPKKFYQQKQKHYLDKTTKNISSKSGSLINLHQMEDPIINLDSDDDDDDIMVVENITKKRSNLKRASGVILQASPKKKFKITSDIAVIDISTPISKTNRDRTKFSKKFIHKLKRRSKVQNTSGKSFEQYTSILGCNGQSINTSAYELNSSQPSTSYSLAPDSSTHTSGLVQDPVSSAVPSSSVYGNNLYNPNPCSERRTGLRPVVIDGSNVAMRHSNGKYFSSRGLQICINYFLKRNHKVIAFVPRFRRSGINTQNPEILDELEKSGLLSFTPSRRIGSRLVVPYDDRYIVQYAAECGGVIVSTDNFFDLLHENIMLKETIENRLLMFTWVGDVLMFPQDPLGRNGPNLERFLQFP